ncbi:MAG: CBS domain-containing protein [Methanobacteriota archaeon]
MKVGDLMNVKVIKASPKESVKDAARRMADAGISGVPVVDDSGKLVGILSESDIVGAVKKRTKVLKMVYPSLSMVSVSFVEEDMQTEISKAMHEVADMKVQDVMHQKVLTVKPGDDLSVAVNLMNGHNVNRLPVVGDEGLVGILSRGDVVRGMFKGRD